MRTSRRMLKQVRRALYAALAFSGCINLLALATPLYALQVFETVVPRGSFETLAVLTAIAAAALVTLAILEGVRHNILLRAGLWLDHHLSRHIVHAGVTTGRAKSAIAHDTAALQQFRSFLTSGAAAVMLDVLWIPIFIGALFVLNPALGMLALGTVALLTGLALLQNISAASLAREASQSENASQAWWTKFSSIAPSRHGQIEQAARTWEQINCRHVTSLYAHGKHASGHEAASRAVCNAAQLALIGAGAWLIMQNEMSPAAVVAASILLARVLSPFERLSGPLVSAHAAYQAYGRLKAWPAAAISSGVDQISYAEDMPPFGEIGDELVAHMAPPQAMYTGYGMAGVH